MAQSAVAAIRSGCEMLRDGKAEIDKFKKTVEGGVANAQAIYKEVTGIWGWIKGLLVAPAKPVASIKPTAPIEAAKPVAKKANRQPETKLSYEEFQARAVHEICENLKVYFEAIRALKLHCRELEEEALTTEKVADSAIDRIEIEWQLQQLAAQLKDAMIYQTPKDLNLGAMYENFLITYHEIVEAQEFARAVKAKEQRDAKWRRELLKHHRIDRAVTAVTVLVLILWMWGVVLSLGWLVRTPSGLLRLLLS
jgi:hypothetical protein